MVEELTTHPPGVQVLKGNGLFDLRTGHTKSYVSTMTQSRNASLTYVKLIA